MKRIAILLITILAYASASAKSYSPSDFIFPVEDVEGLFSANFGELRPDHYHSGVDIKTNGVEGKRIVAVADGYISRISMSPYGFGLALYLTHRNGTTSVYGHLSRFAPAVAKYVERERYRTKAHTVNLFCGPNTFPVKQGEVIAYSGNTGGSFGPHLHFELRHTSSQRPINVIAEGIISSRDDISPLIFKLHYIEVDSLQGVARTARRRSYDAKKVGSEYQIAGGKAIDVGRKGFFVVEASDRKNGTTNTYGLYSLSAKLDGNVMYKYLMNSLSFATTRNCNSVLYYPIKIDSRNEVFCLAKMEGTSDEHIKTIVNQGVVTTTEGQKREMLIEATDDSGNTSKLRFSIVGKADSDCFVAQAVDASMVINCKKDFSYNAEGLAVMIPKGALYESKVFSGGVSSRALTAREDELALSPIYNVLDRTVPLHKAISISISADIPYQERSKVGLMCISRSGKAYFIKGKYNLGSVSATSRNLGQFYVTCDTTAPTLKLGIEEGSNQTRSSYFTCGLADDLSGVSSYSATIDGQWIALDLDKGRTKHIFRTKPDGKTHTLIYTATDGCGNTTTVTRSYIR